MNTMNFIIEAEKNIRQSFFALRTAISAKGIYHTKSGTLSMNEPLPEDHGDGRLIRQNGKYYLSVSYIKPVYLLEFEGRVVALDPGIRNFMAWFSEFDCGTVGNQAFGRIQRICQHMDKLISKHKKEKRRFAKKNIQRAIQRMRQKLTDLINELHHKTARYLVDNYDVILIPSFETSDMVKKLGRKIGRKSVRSMLTFAHYRFRQFLMHKARQFGKLVKVVNEAYTSKTCSWSGEIVQKLGGLKSIKGSDGIILGRDINGARGIFLRALGDTPWLRELIRGACIGTEALTC